MSQLNPVQALLSYLFAVDFSIILRFHLGVTGGVFFLRFSSLNLTCTYVLPVHATCRIITNFITLIMF